MRNKELIQSIYEICSSADYRDEGHVVPEIVIDLIEKERPELCTFLGDDFWDGGHLDLPTLESKTKEMKEHPHQDNHMD